MKRIPFLFDFFFVYFNMNRKKIWVNGTFDILHVGHIRLFKFASDLGNVRVGLDTDDRIKTLKGDNRPFNSLSRRIEFLSAISYIDTIVTFNSDIELINRIKEYQPDIMVIGSDYKNKKIIGSEYIPNIVYFDLVNDVSSTKILKYYENINNRK